MADYSSCSLGELLDIERHIDKKAHPQRYAALQSEIRLRREQGESESMFPSTPAESDVDFAMEYKYHTFWRRFWALFIDGLIFAPLGWIQSWMLFSEVKGLPLFLVMAVSALSNIAYYILMHAAFGQTLGKMATGVIVLDVSETRLRLRQAALRDIVPLLFLPYTLYESYLWAFGDATELYSESGNLVVYYAMAVWAMLEIVTMLFNRKRRALHDFIAGSVVVRKAAIKH